MTNLASSLLEAQKAMPAIHKDSKAEVPTKTGRGFSYTYLSLQGLLQIAVPVLNEHGLALVQVPGIRDDGQQVLKTTLFHAESDGSFTAETPLILTGAQTPQTWGGAVTYARRYALTSMLGIAADEDDDGAAASRPKVSRQANKPVAKTDDDFPFEAKETEKPPESVISEIRKLATDLLADDSTEAKELQKSLGKLSWREDPTEAQMALAKLRNFFSVAA